MGKCRAFQKRATSRNLKTQSDDKRHCKFNEQTKPRNYPELGLLAFEKEFCAIP